MFKYLTLVRDINDMKYISIYLWSKFGWKDESELKLFVHIFNCSSQDTMNLWHYCIVYCLKWGWIIIIPNIYNIQYVHMKYQAIVSFLLPCNKTWFTFFVKKSTFTWWSHSSLKCYYKGKEEKYVRLKDFIPVLLFSSFSSVVPFLYCMLLLCQRSGMEHIQNEEWRMRDFKHAQLSKAEMHKKVSTQSFLYI